MTLDQDPTEPARQAEQQLQEIILAASQRQSAAQAELARLKSEYADLLIELAMNRSRDTTRKTKLRGRIRDLEADLDDFPLLERGFAREQAKITAQFNQARVVLKHRVTYAELKERIEAEGPGLATVENLKLWAEKLGWQDDCEAFLDAQQAGGKAA